MTRKTTKIDCHVHTRGSDGWGSPDDFVNYARAAKLDGLCIADHHRTYTAEGLEVARALRKAGLLAFHACEYSTAWGHLLIYGVNVEQFNWGYFPDPRLVIRDVRAAGGLCVPAHPYKGYKRTFGDRVKTLKGIVGIETANGQAAVSQSTANKRAALVVANSGLIGLGGSDAHRAQNVGICYTRFDAIIQTERDLLKAMRKGLSHAVTSRQRVQEEMDLRSWLAKTDPLTMKPSLVSLDSGAKSMQVSMDGYRDGFEWWGGPSTTPH